MTTAATRRVPIAECDIQTPVAQAATNRPVIRPQSFDVARQGKEARVEQKVIVLMTSSEAERDAMTNLQKQIDETLAEHRGWNVTSANTTMAATVSTAVGLPVTRFYVTTLVLENNP